MNFSDDPDPSGDDSSRLPAFDLRDRTFDYALSIIRFVSGFPESREITFPGDELLKSGTSVGAHYREAHRCRSKPEFGPKIQDCLAALELAGYWLDVMEHLPSAGSPDLDRLKDETAQLTAIFMSISRKTR